MVRGTLKKSNVLQGIFITEVKQILVNNFIDEDAVRMLPSLWERRDFRVRRRRRGRVNERV
jgi:hypothetical protein